MDWWQDYWIWYSLRCGKFIANEIPKMFCPIQWKHHLSHHSLYFNCKNDKDLGRTLLDKKIDVTTDEYISLNERRNKHLALICKSRRIWSSSIWISTVVYVVKELKMPRWANRLVHGFVLSSKQRAVRNIGGWLKQSCHDGG